MNINKRCKILLPKRIIAELRNLGYIVKINEEVTGFSGIKHKMPILVMNPDNNAKIAIHYEDGSGEVQVLKLFSFYADTGIEQVLLSDRKSELNGVKVFSIKRSSDIIRLVISMLGETNKLKIRTHILSF